MQLLDIIFLDNCCVTMYVKDYNYVIYAKYYKAGQSIQLCRVSKILRMKGGSVMVCVSVPIQVYTAGSNVPIGLTCGRHCAQVLWVLIWTISTE